MGNASCGSSAAVADVAREDYNVPASNIVNLEDSGEINSNLSKLCVDSWEQLTGDTCTSIDVIPNFARLGFFSAQVLQRLYEYPEVFHAFKPRNSRSSSNDTFSKYILMYRIIRYMLSVKDSSLKIRQQLRVMGRNHMRIGVTEEQMRIFGDVLMYVIEKLLGSSGSNKILSAWRRLLDFIIEQFYFDRVTFLGHLTQDPVGCLAPVSAMHRNSDQMLSDGGSVQSSVNVFKLNEEEELDSNVVIAHESSCQTTEHGPDDFSSAKYMTSEVNFPAPS